MFRFLSRAKATIIDSEQETRKHLLWWFLARVVLFTLLFALTTVLRERGLALAMPSMSTSIAFLAILYSTTFASALFLQRGCRSVRRFGLLQLCGDAGIIALLIYATGCSKSDFTSLMILPVLAAGLILYRRGGLFLAAVTTIAYGANLTMEQLRWLPDYLKHAPHIGTAVPLSAANLFAVYGLLLFLGALLSGQLARRLRVTEERLHRTALEYDRLSLLYKQIFEDISTGIITTDQSDFITSCNQAAERITGIPREQVLGQPFIRCFPAMFLQEAQGRDVCDFNKPDGSTIRIGYSFSFLNMPVPAEQELESELEREQKEEERQASWKVVTLQDISQIERMEQQIREAEKMAAIGELSASIAHDFRNPLAAISGSAQILAMEANNIGSHDPATFKTLMGIILRETDRMAKAITDFLQFARPAAIQPEWFDISRLVDEVLTQMQQSINMVAGTVAKDIGPHVAFWADRQQIHTILAHLLDNACHAVAAQQGKVVVAAGEGAGDGQGELWLEVRDQGSGIPPEFREQVFTPFFSIRTDGTGLGLAIVRQIVENHGGKVELDAAPDYPCIVRVRLPMPSPATP
ncbi:MAG: PAS domain-containing protein [Desulfobulbus sp.]|jgi:two-component system sensor histidine kinase PilS (NtrC family)|uniref:two-component system sensor histidine kinase NtrB n=1 Tax=Desulfobulbus sp. TaxID=895 RepID=UPI0028438179|nr:ATP-binding protein [Desulfobulbus sp.]MDR2550832.1 PAS domain-containing protein [Desulfobulbus sp.]